jgi:ArsR family transcriptional regulator
MDNRNKFRAKVFKALADPVRLSILDFLRDGEKCVCVIVPHLKLIQPVVSRHLRILKECGMIKDRKEGTRRLYSITSPKIFSLTDGVTPELVIALRAEILEQIA